MIAWNFVNLSDAEGGWFIKLLGLLLVAAFITRFAKVLLEKLHQKFEMVHYLWQDAFVRAVYKPFCSYIWFLTIITGIDLVADRFLSEQLKAEAGLVAKIALVLVVAWFFFSWKNNIIRALLAEKSTIEPGKIIGFGKLASAFIIVITLLFLMEVSGLNVNTIIAFGGISGLALAIASQEIVSNFFGGMMIYITRPFITNDAVALPGSSIEGVVEDIGWYQTTLRGTDGKPIYVPNSLFTKAYVTNGSRIHRRKLNTKIFLRQQDLAQVPKIAQDIEEFLRSHPSIDKNDKIRVHIDRISVYSIDMTIMALSLHGTDSQFLKLQDELFLKVGQVIAKHGAEFAQKTAD